MAVLLLVEDEDVLRRSMARELRRIAGVQVLEAESVDEALLYVDRHRPDVVVTDLDLPRRDGLDLIAELSRLGLHVPVIVVSGQVARFADRIPATELIQVLEKPVAPGTLRAYVESIVGGEWDTGRMSFTVADFLQIAATGRRSVCIEARWPDGKEGRVCVYEGEAWDARYGALRGMAALAAVALRPGAQIDLRALEAPPPERTLHGSAEALLLEATRLLDEYHAGRSGPVLGDDAWVSADSWGRFLALAEEEGTDVTTHETVPPSTAEFEEPTPAEAFDDLLDAAVNASLERDYRAAARFFLLAERARPGHPTVRANLQRLKEMGVLDDEETGGASPSGGGEQ